MGIYICVVPATVAMVIWFLKMLIQERKFESKNDNRTRIKREIYFPKSYEDHNTQFRNSGEKTTILWEVEGIDPSMEERLLQSIKDKIKE